MRLTTINVSGVRNLSKQDIAFGRGLNLLMGANGQGKTSVLEAIYLLGTTRSFRTTRVAEIVTSGEGSARVEGLGEAPGEGLAILISKKERRLLKHGKAAAPADYIGTMNVVALSNDLVQGFRRLPSERRRFLDRMALATYPSYLADLREMRRTSVQRALLAAAGARGAQRELWDARAAAAAIPVAKRRLEMAEALGERLAAASKEVFPEGEAVSLKLQSTPRYAPGEDAAYAAELETAFAAQPASGRRETPAGPMRDDLAIAWNGRDLLRLGSAGQVRALLTAAVLAEMRRLREIKGLYPVLVLDDVDADLDEGRYGALLDALGDGAQVFAATSKARLAPGAAANAKRFTVTAGIVATAA